MKSLDEIIAQADSAITLSPLPSGCFMLKRHGLGVMTLSNGRLAVEMLRRAQKLEREDCDGRVA